MINNNIRGVEEIFETFANNDEEKMDINVMREVLSAIYDLNIQLKVIDVLIQGKKDIEHYNEKENIDSLHINAAAAFEIFQGKVYNIPNFGTTIPFKYFITD